jgi:DAACS family dicarboxylate/amino acid:cation (Na+ or H+) symporter
MDVPHRSILLALVFGALAGIMANVWGQQESSSGQLVPWLAALVHYGTEPIGRLFMNLLLMTVVPLVFASLAAGVIRLGGLQRLGRLGLRTLSYFLLTTTIAVLMGLILVDWWQPGKIVDASIVQQMQAVYSQPGRDRIADTNSELGTHWLTQIVPRNPIQAAVEMNMLGVIVFSLLFGIGVQQTHKSQCDLLLALMDTITDAMVAIIGLALRVAPVGVFALIFTTVSQFGLSLLLALAMYVGVVLLGLAIQLFVVFPVLVRVLARRSPWEFFQRIHLVLLTAFSTSSSNATLSTSLRTAEMNLGISPSVAGFVLPLGATLNMNGTALFEGVTVLFLAQVAGVELSLTQQLVILGLSVVTAIGAAGVPGGSIPLLAILLAAVQVPPDYLFLILGVDRLLDMCRTTVNVTGDLVAASYIDRLAVTDGTD